MKNNILVNDYNDKLLVYPYMTFGDWLRENIKDRGWSNAELARRAKLSPTYVGDLIRGHKPNDSQKKVRPSEDVTETIAKVFGANLNQVRELAGYVSKDAPGRVHNAQEFLDALAFHGIPIPKFAHGIKHLEKVGEDELNEALNSMLFTLAQKASKYAEEGDATIIEFPK